MNGPLILIVDDQAGVRLLLREVFREAGYRVTLAAHGQEALVLASAELPALALVDLKMPVMDGLETLRALKGLDPTMPVLMMTAVGEGRVSELTANGAHDCITKPFDVFALRDQVQRVLQEEGRL
ncbi:MAG: response regulator [Bacillota bacterium]